MTRRIHEIHDQNFYALASIQSFAIGLAGLIVGPHLAEQYGVGVALCSVLIGNLILWLIGIGIVSMVYKDSVNAIENIKNYLGKIGAILIAFILFCTFLNWFAVEIKITMLKLDELKQLDLLFPSKIWNYFGIMLGLFTAFVAIGGIRIIKWIAMIGLPILICYLLYFMINFSYSIELITFGISFPAVIFTILYLLPGIVNLPTFFRHSSSRINSYLALTLMTVFNTFLECAAIWMDLIHPNTIFAGNQIVLSIVLIFLLIYVNLVNIYFASACYETFFPKFSGMIGHVLMGLIGTACFILMSNNSHVTLLVDLFDCYIANLGVVLLIAFLVRTVVKHRIRNLERTINICAWLFGCLVGTIFRVQNPDDEVRFLLVSAGVSALFYLIVMFIEETNWAIDKINDEKSKKA